ncbi:MAG: flagellar hook basal-body protein [Planctomycetota bacterium]|nr:MAG: flagellar hook basal-body protein [Planctomycetota bacterium]
MPKGIYAAASAMYTERRSLDAIAQNLANASTVGYRRAEALRGSFAQTLADTHGRNGGIDGDGGAGIHQAGIWRDYSQGTSRETGRDLDVSLDGPGFFMVQADDGETLLTRAGHLTVDDQNRLVGQHGWPVLGQDGPIVLPENSLAIQIDERGRILSVVQGDAGLENEFIEQLRIVELAAGSQEDLRPRNGQFFSSNGVELEDSVNSRVHQGRLEDANLNAVTELVKMITIQRHYEAAQKALSQQSRTGEGFSEIIHRA